RGGPGGGGRGGPAGTRPFPSGGGAGAGDRVERAAAAPALHRGVRLRSGHAAPHPAAATLPAPGAPPGSARRPGVPGVRGRIHRPAAPVTGLPRPGRGEPPPTTGRPLSRGKRPGSPSLWRGGTGTVPSPTVGRCRAGPLVSGWLGRARAGTPFRPRLCGLPLRAVPTSLNAPLGLLGDSPDFREVNENTAERW